MQMAHINTMLSVQKIKDVRFEQCVVLDNSGGPSDIPYYTPFKYPLGETLAQVCIEDDCRSRLANIAKYILTALKVLSTGPTSYFVIGNMNGIFLIFI